VAGVRTQLDMASLDAAVTAIAAARHIDLYGAGATSWFMAQDLQARLFRLGLSANVGRLSAAVAAVRSRRRRLAISTSAAARCSMRSTSRATRGRVMRSRDRHAAGRACRLLLA
jgi:DNA-binding MurR/RpiR family transcriptional regulator